MLSALALIPFVVLLVYLGGWPFALLVAAAAAMMQFEWLQMMYRPRSGPALCSALAISAAMLLVQAQLHAAALLALAVSGALAWLGTDGSRSRWWIALGAVWFGVPCAALVWLRGTDTGGADAVLWTLLMIWAADSGAYFAGRSIGGPKLAPRISPNKTWAGLLGGMIVASVTSVVFALIWGAPAILPGAMLALLLAPWSQVGDLAESAVKRHVGVKDSGALIPGHGGILDRVDALLFAVPAVALVAAVWPMGNLPWQ